jgi:hypothetical protein
MFAVRDSPNCCPMDDNRGAHQSTLGHSLACGEDIVNRSKQKTKKNSCQTQPHYETDVITCHVIATRLGDITHN